MYSFVNNLGNLMVRALFIITELREVTFSDLVRHGQNQSGNSFQNFFGDSPTIWQPSWIKVSF